MFADSVLQRLAAKDHFRQRQSETYFPAVRDRTYWIAQKNPEKIGTYDKYARKAAGGA